MRNFLKVLSVKEILGPEFLFALKAKSIGHGPAAIRRRLFRSQKIK
jgi:hypothetical protein